MVRFVRMVHRRADAEADMPERSVNHHRRAGWELADKPAPEPDLPSVVEVEDEDPEEEN